MKYFQSLPSSRACSCRQCEWSFDYVMDGKGDVHGIDICSYRRSHSSRFSRGQLRQERPPTLPASRRANAISEIANVLTVAGVVGDHCRMTKCIRSSLDKNRKRYRSIGSGKEADQGRLGWEFEMLFESQSHRSCMMLLVRIVGMCGIAFTEASAPRCHSRRRKVWLLFLTIIHV